ncbi:MotA/TolQ/ExbB proton channel family protein [Benzoatithermus flavus]|uniref:MotA/TolQ/ExbB proton channel family protein n=1 Tax=Benzoatithermus flavus TaxID=3108223 RepID=A0ABU8XRG8_9PROT
MNTLAAAEPVADIRTGYVDEVEFAPTPRAREIGRYRYLLLLRFALINVTGFALLGAIWMQGWIARILAADDTHICKLIFSLFLIGLFWAGQKIVMLSRELNALEGEGIDQPGSRVAAYMDAIVGRDGQSRANLLGALRMKIGHRIAVVRHMASTLVLLGLIGTIVGFIIALSGVNQDAVTDSAAIGPMVATLLHGMAMALFKTLVGSVLNVWLMVNYRLLESGATHLLTHLVEVGERDAAV